MIVELDKPKWFSSYSDMINARNYDNQWKGRFPYKETEQHTSWWFGKILGDILIRTMQRAFSLVHVLKQQIERIIRITSWSGFGKVPSF